MCHRNASSEEDLNHCLFILGKLHMASFRQGLDCLWTHWVHNGDFLENDNFWNECRAGLEDYESSLRAVSRYWKRHLRPLGNSAFQERFEELRDNQEDVRADIKSFEALIRNRLQVQMGTTSVEDSKKKNGGRRKSQIG